MNTAAEKNRNDHLFSNGKLFRILIPIIAEQILTALMGTMDIMMVSNVGPAAISAVSLVDSVNILFIQMFAALTAGGAIVCAHYVGMKDRENTVHAAEELLLIVLLISSVISVLFLLIRNPLLRFVFGSVDPDVMAGAETYFFYTALSYPFIALFNAGSSIFRAGENTRLPLRAAVLANILNIFGNAVCIFLLHWGVAGAAIPTLVSRMFGAFYVLYFLRKPHQTISITDYKSIRPDMNCIRRILSLGIPNGIENSMFQFGKLAIQSTVSTMGTISIAAQAMTNSLESLNGIAGVGMGIGIMNIVGECLGARRKDEAVYYIKKLTLVSELVVTFSCILFFLLTKPITALAGMKPESAAMCFSMMKWITVMKPLAWTLAFTPAYGMRAAGDVKFSMTVSCISMWVNRVALCIFLVRCFHMGPMAVWIGMFTDWSVRAVVFSFRFMHRKWLRHRVV